jgi:putative nucleotidyltransferase with HDIG domain
MSNDKYKKYLDPSFSLLEKYREIAPGSYKHSQNVASICESIAIELDLDVELMRCCGVYHDIGKMNYPLNFSENQASKTNIHDDVEPNVSYHLITRHVADGVLILLQNDFPLEIIKIISEHHGDTLLRQFHKKDAESPEDLFRYKGKKPTSMESIVLMIVDSVEATSRAMIIQRKDDEENGEFIKRVIRLTIERLDDDDQLDQILHGAIKQIKRILSKELESIYHKRVTYKDEENIDEVTEIKNKK